MPTNLMARTPEATARAISPSQCASNAPLPSVYLFSTAVATIAIASLFKHEVLWRDAPHDDGAGSAGTSTDVICNTKLTTSVELANVGMADI